MKPQDFDLQTGVARVYWELDVAGDALDDRWSEDLIQVELHNGLVVDVGWYPGYSSLGEFHVVVIRDQDWAAPVHTACCKTIPELQALFGEALRRARDGAFGAGSADPK